MWTTASVMGPVLGGWFAAGWGWRWMFWINLPLCLIAFLVTDRRLKRLPRRERPHALDYPGAVLLVASAILFQLFLTSGGVRFAWLSAPSLGLLGATVVSIAALVWKLRTAREPLIPYTLLSNNIVLTGSASVGVAMASYIALSIYLPIYFETIRGLGAAGSGLALMPLMVCPTIGALGAARALVRMRRYTLVPVTGLLCAAAALLPLFVWPQALPFSAVELLLSIVAAGVGAVFPTTTVSVQNAVEPHQLGTATSLVTFSRSLGATIGVAVFGAIVIGAGANEVYGANAMGAGQADFFVEKFRWIFLAGSGGFALSALILLRMKPQPLRDLR